jgi:hypothetical protein
MTRSLRRLPLVVGPFKVPLFYTQKWLALLALMTRRPGGGLRR